MIATSLLRAYDIRGVYGRDLTDEAAVELGKRFGVRVLEACQPLRARVVVARDGRMHSPQLSTSFISGLQHVGCDVVDIGLAPTPAVSFALREKEAGFHAGVMVTGSHNPPEHNGFKLALGLKPFFGEDIQNLMQAQVPPCEVTGRCEIDTTFVDRYIQHLLRQCPTLPPELQIVWDCGHGATGPVVQMLSDAWRKQGSSVHVLYGEVDGRFPAHAPDPSHAANMADLIQAVQQPNMIGLALDGDGDRLGVVLPGLGLLSAEHVLWHMARMRLQSQKGRIVLMDVKMSANLPPLLQAHGGDAFVWKTGHAHIKNKMSELDDVAIAGEASGHFFFPELGYDDGLYAAVSVLASYHELSQSVCMYPASCITPELRLHCEDPHQAIIDLRSILDQKGVRYNDLDGVRLQSEDGWWLARASHTESVITVRVESFTNDLSPLAQAVCKLLENILTPEALAPLSYWAPSQIEKVRDIQLETTSASCSTGPK